MRLVGRRSSGAGHAQKLRCACGQLAFAILFAFSRDWIHFSLFRANQRKAENEHLPGFYRRRMEDVDGRSDHARP
jgi:hypothetical protein